MSQEASTTDRLDGLMMMQLIRSLSVSLGVREVQYVNNINHVNDDNLIADNSVNEGKEDSSPSGLFLVSLQHPLVPVVSRRQGQTAEYS